MNNEISTTKRKNEIKGHFLLLGTLVISLVLPLALILLSYIEVIVGTAEFIAAMAVIMAGMYIILGSAWMFYQDSKDENPS